MSRTSLAVDEKIAKQLATIAKERKMTLYALVNEIMENAVKLLNEGADIRVISNLWLVHRLLSEVDAVILPSDFMDDLIAELYRHDSEKLLKRFYKLGQEVSALIKIYAKDLDQLIHLADTYAKYLPIKNLEIKYLGNITYEVGLIGIGNKIESTKCIMEFLKGLLSEYNITIIEHNVARGIIHLKLKQDRQ